MKTPGVILLLILLFSGIRAENRFEIHGLPYNLEKNIREITGKEVDSAVFLDNVVRELNRYGYFQPRISLRREKQEWTASGKAGKRAVVDTVLFSGNRIYSSDTLLLVSALSAGAGFDGQRISEGIGNILTLYEDHGYPFCRVFLKDDSTVSLEHFPVRLKIEEGNKYYLDRITVEGNRISKPYVILRETGLKKGAVFSQSAVDASVFNLERMDLFETVEKPELLVHSRRFRMDVRYRVMEKKTFYAEGVVGYQPGDNEAEDPWAGSGTIEVLNILGTGRKGNLNVDKYTGYTRFYFSYTEPWIARRPLDVTVSMKMEIQEKQYSELITDLESRFRINRYWSLKGRAERTILNAEEDSVSALTYGLGSGVERNSFDFPLNPRTGFLFTSDLTVRRKEKNSRFYREWTARNSVEGAFPVLRRLVLYAKILEHNIESQQAVLLRSERLRLGGPGSVRGYLNGQFAADRYLTGSAEVRFLPDKKSRLYLFADGGPAWWKESRDNRNIQETAYLFGFGAGIQMPTRIGVLKIDIASNYKTTLRDMKIHAGLKAAL